MVKIFSISPFSTEDTLLRHYQALGEIKSTSFFRKSFKIFALNCVRNFTVKLKEATKMNYGIPFHGIL